MKKVICFCRVSTTQQDLEAQRAEVVKQILKDNFKGNEILFVEGKESAIKLDEEERVTLQELKKAISENPSIKDVYIFAVDRLARKVGVVISIVEKMSKDGINLHFLNPYPMQTLRNGKEDSMGKAFLTFMAIGAEMEMKIKKERFVAAKSKMKSEGRIYSGSPMFGYYRDENAYPQVNEDEAEVVRRVFDEYIAGGTYYSIAKGLIMDGYFGGDVQFHSIVRKISNTINNLAYSGRNKGSFKYPLIVDAETQDKAIEMAKKSLLKERQSEKHIYYAKGLCKAYYDGNSKNMIPLIGQYSYSVHDQSKVEKETQMNVNINVIETIAWTEAVELHKLFKSYEDFQLPFHITNNCKELERQIQNLQPHIEAVKEKQKRINNLYTKGRLDEDDYEAQYAETEKEMSIYTNEQKKLERQIKRYQVQKERLNELKSEELDYDGMNDEERQELCQQMIDEIIVEKDGEFSARTGRHNYIIRVIPTKEFKISLAGWVWKYSVCGGQKTLYRSYRTDDEGIDFTDRIIPRFVNDRKKRYADYYKAYYKAHNKKKG